MEVVLEDHAAVNLNKPRERNLNRKPTRSGPVIYWMQRDQRGHDNWALMYALEQARTTKQSCLVVFCLQPHYLGVKEESVHYDFMWQGLLETAETLQSNGVYWLIVDGSPTEIIPSIAHRCQAGRIYTDFNPLRTGRLWRQQVADRLNCCLTEVDAHNIVPCWQASEKLEYAARTFRPKINRQLENWLIDFPEQPDPREWMGSDRIRADGTAGDATDAGLTTVIQPWLDRSNRLMEQARRRLSALPSGNGTVPRGGSAAAAGYLKSFIADRLALFEKRNDPNQPAVSGLSPYLHFGQISAQAIALAVHRAVADNPRLTAVAAEFLEELIVRRELSDNYCHYMPDYDNWQGLPAWGRRTLENHRSDLRPNRYTREQLEYGDTHDPLWNAAQRNLIRTAAMPGYLRMYWAKKILEWTPDPQLAQPLAIELNDRYMLDGRDPNGYTGIAWSIGGLHDRPWIDRPIFGQIRFMTLSGCRRKFDVDAWIQGTHLIK